MCRYCRHLQELRKEDQRTIERWKRYCEREERMLRKVYCWLDEMNDRDVQIMGEIENFLRKDTIR